MGAPLSKYGQYMVIWIHEPARSSEQAGRTAGHRTPWAWRNGIFGGRKALEAKTMPKAKY